MKKNVFPDISATCMKSLGTIGSDHSSFTTLTDQDILDAIERPAGAPDDKSGSLDTFRPGESICLIVSDHTRDTAADRILPALVSSLARRGCSIDNMFIVFASGIHRHPTAKEVSRILGTGIEEQFNGRVFFHDPDNGAELVDVGTTGRGHAVRVNRRAMAAKRRIIVGGVIYHYHAGFGGGRKSIVPGLAARETIAWNHSLTLDPGHDRICPGVEPGRLNGNPVAEEMLECARMCDVDFAVNTVLTADHRLAAVFAGKMESSHRKACRFAEQLYRCDIKKPADIVMATANGASNWIQSHKALFNASRAMKPGGTIILHAPAGEGLGNEEFRRWVTMDSIEQIYSCLRKDPAVLGQTALSTRTRGASTILVTEMPAKDVHDLGIRTAPDMAAGLKTALSDLRDKGILAPTCWLMPDALYTVPFVSP